MASLASFRNGWREAVGTSLSRLTNGGPESFRVSTLDEISRIQNLLTVLHFRFIFSVARH